jgi:6-phosphogluconolactonase
MNTALPLAVLLLTACADNLNYPLGGTVTGLTSSMVLQDNDGYTTISLNVTVNGGFFFAAAFPNGTAYNVTVLTQPIGQTCIVKNASGTGTGRVTSVVVDCSNNAPDKYAYVANYGSNDISQYAIGADGALTAMATASVAAGTNPNSVTVDPSGQYAYVANAGSNNVSQYAISTTDGTLMLVTTVAAGTNPYSITVHPSGKYAYVANEGDGTISQYAIGAGGALTAMAIESVAAGKNPNSATVDPPGQYAYVANSGSNNISQYAISASGALTAMATASVAAGTNPYSVTVDALSQYAYVTNEGGYNVSQYTIGAGGALTSIVTATTVAAGTNPTSIIIAP